jgi:hypothetical protein
MSDESVTRENVSQRPEGEPGYVSRRAERRMRRMERREARVSNFGGAWILGVALILVGAVLLLQNLGIYTESLGNWWALFILIPAAGAFGAAWNSYQRTGGFNEATRASLVGGLILTLITAALLFELRWDIIWPLIIILIGVGALLGSRLKV